MNKNIKRFLMCLLWVIKEYMSRRRGSEPPGKKKRGPVVTPWEPQRKESRRQAEKIEECIKDEEERKKGC